MSIKTAISEAQAAARSHAVIGGKNSLSIQTPGGTIVGEPVRMNSYQNSNLPTLWALKAAPGQKYVHIDGDGKEYPGLYVYTGVNPSVALESVHVKSPWIAEGSHPVYFTFARLWDYLEDDPKTYLRPEDGDTSDPSQLTEFDASWLTAEGIKNSFARTKDVKSVDGWYELPIAARVATPIYAVAYIGMGGALCLGFFAVECQFGKLDLTSPQDMNDVCALEYLPDFSAFQTAVGINSDCFHGIIGAPKMICGNNPYSTDANDYYDASEEDGIVWNMYASGTTMEFIDTTDTNEIAFRPMLKGLNDDEHLGDGDEKWQYRFCLEFQPTEWLMSKTVPGNTSYGTYVTPQKKQYVKKVTVDEGDLYKCTFVPTSGQQNTLYLLDPNDSFLESFGMERTCNIVWDGDKADLWTNKGEEIVLSIEPEQGEDTALQHIDPKRTLNCWLRPVYIGNTQNNYDQDANGLLAYYPVIVAGRENTGSYNAQKTRMPIDTGINACEILGATWSWTNRTLYSYNVGAGENDNGPYPADVGENCLRNIGQLCPTYRSYSLGGLFSPILGDSWRHIQQDQYANEGESGVDTMGKYLHQNGSIDLWTEVSTYGRTPVRYYSLYEFENATATDVRDHYEDEDGNPLSPTDEWIGQTATDTVSLVARVRNNDEHGEVPYLSGAGTQGYHLEYLDIEKLFDALHWVRGADYRKCYGQSIALGTGDPEKDPGNFVIISFS